MMKLDNRSLAPGMVLARDVYDLKAGLLIVGAGISLTDELIKKLQQFPRIEIYVEELSSVMQDEHENRLREVMAVHHERTVERAKNILNNAGQPPDSNLLSLMVDDLQEQIDLSSNVLLNLTQIKFFDNYLYSHVVNVSMLALIIGRQFKLNSDEMRDLGITALLHDYGMVKLDHAVYDHNRRLNRTEWEQVKRHPEYGVEMLQNAEQISPKILKGILEHHERLDGSGYPHQKRGSELGMFGKIIAVADVYDACISKRKYRDPFTPQIALKNLLSESKLYDLEIMKAFVAAMSIYPIGSYVCLNTGEIGKVIGCNPKEPFRPDIHVLLDRDRQKIDSPYRLKLNLEENRQSFIAANLEGEELQTMLTLLDISN
jgi:HD-GYP domain-containing protein (c-di-GMP phosphodiesterase class II)